MTWVISDSKMEEIIKKLDECGDKDKEDITSSDVSPSPYSQSESQF